MKHFLFILLFALTGAANAASYYVSDCGAGANAQCVAGNDANAGTSAAAPWRTCAQVSSRFPALAAGDQVLFARGSSQTACNLYYLSNLNSRAGNPIVLGAYTPSWATATTATPILNGTTSSYTLGLVNSGNSTHDEGYVVQDLHFVGAGVTSAYPAMMMANDVDYVTIRRVEIEGYAAGIQCSGGTNNTLAVGSDGASEHIVIRESNIHHNRGMGVLTSCNDMLIENNRFDNNGVGMLDHHIYLNGATIAGVEQTVKQVVVRGNTLTNNSPYASATAMSPTPGGCGAVAIIAHGLKSGIIIEGNTISEPTIPSSGSCWGISVDSGSYGMPEGFNQVVIRGNTVINYALGIGVDMCDTCTVENNYVYSEMSASSGIVAPSKYFQAAIPGNTLNNKLTVRNNTVYLKTPGASSVGVRISRDGAGHVVASNLTYFGTGSTSATACFNTSGLATTAFNTFDNNLCYYAATLGSWDTTRTTLAAQQAAGFDLHSKAVNPVITAPVAPLYSMVMGSGSPAINAGHPTQSSKFANRGVLRNTTSDIGAFQQSATVVVPNSPTGMGIQ